MERLLSLLFFAVLFYLIMRFGCGAHMVHGRHGGHERKGHGTEGGASGSARDPVCGMPVAAGQGYSEVYQGRELHFCSRACLDKFDAEPQRYPA
jgi:YHS domain-containing protein